MKSYLLCIASLLGAGAAVAQPTFLTRDFHPERRPIQDLGSIESSKVMNAQSQGKRGTTSSTLPGIMMIYDWSTSTNKWVLPPAQYKYTYNSQGKQQQIMLSDSAVTQPKSRYSFSYNSNGLASISLAEIWTGTAWQNAARSVFSYDSRGHETEWLRQNWVNGVWENEARDISIYGSLQIELIRQNWINGAWQNKARILYTFDTEGRYTSDVYQSWDGNKITYGYRTTFTYNANGDRTQQLSENWDVSRNDFVSAYRYSYTYNAEGGTTEEIDEEWNDAFKSFILTRRYIYTVVGAQPWSEYVLQLWQYGTYVNAWRTINPTRDAEQRLTYYETQHWYGTNWQTDERYTAKYKENGSSEQLVEKYANGKWINSTLDTSINDDEGSMIGRKRESWNGNSWKVSFGWRVLMNYDASGNLTRRVSQDYNTIDEKYVNTKLYTYNAYQAITLANRQAVALTAATQIYPNPATDKATLQLASLPQGQGALQAQLLNTLGQVVKQFTLKPQQGSINQELDLSTLKAGVYTLRIQTSEGIVVKQIVRQ